jgi:transcription-repair coupling factor (superfamily II helicase)
VPPEEETVEINVPIEAFIPSFYIPDEEEKISVYQKLAGSEEEAVLQEFREDLLAECGPLPPQVQNLFKILYLKMACRRAGVLRVKAELQGGNREIVLTLTPRVTAPSIIPLLTKNPQWRVSGSTLRIAESALGSDWLQTLHDSVEQLVPKKGA